MPTVAEKLIIDSYTRPPSKTNNIASTSTNFSTNAASTVASTLIIDSSLRLPSKTNKNDSSIVTDPVLYGFSSAVTDSYIRLPSKTNNDASSTRPTFTSTKFSTNAASTVASSLNIDSSLRLPSKTKKK